MDTVKAELTHFETAKDLKPILSVEGPCVSVYLRLAEGTANQTRKANDLAWRELIRQIEPKLQSLGAAGREMLEHLDNWDAVCPEGEQQGRSLSVFRSHDVFRSTWLNDAVASTAVVGPHFYIRPMLRELTSDGVFYILALSQKNVRLLKATSRNAEEVAFPPGTASNYDEYMHTSKPDHDLENRASGGPDMGGGAVLFGTGADRENKGEYLAHFYREIDKGLNEVLRNRKDPVVLVAVEYELALYRSLSRYPHLAQDVQGAPNSLKAGEMHARAIEAMLYCYDRKVDEALTEYNHKVGGGGTNRLKEVITAAYEGRVLTLLVSDSLQTTGVFDESTFEVKGRETGTAIDEDLVNDAAVQTILHAGQVLVAPNAKMPHGSPVAAIFRF
jgi:hypothetical protein